VTILTDARVVQGDQVVEGGWVRWEGERLAEVGRGHLPADRHRSAGGRLVVPGFVDIHVHGGGAAASRPAPPRTAPRSRASIGGTAPPPCWPASSPRHWRISYGRSPPWPSWSTTGSWPGSTWKGRSCHRPVVAHPLELLRVPTRAALEQLLCRRPRAVRMVTLAPELDGGIDAIAQLAAAGAVPAIGHTDAAYDVAHAAVDAGARVATHLFNAMRPIHHREPGVVVALMERPEVVCELINDGLHLHPSLVRWVLGTVGEARAALATPSRPPARTMACTPSVDRRSGCATGGPSSWTDPHWRAAP
jgi:N-acetylglucosamine-6-phosphate deacetylase